MKKIFVLGFLLSLVCLFSRPVGAAAPSETETLRRELTDMRRLMQELQQKMQATEAHLEALEKGEKPVAEVPPVAEAPTAPTREGTPPATLYGQKGWLLNPDISVIANMNYFFRDGPELGFGEFDPEELNVQEVELDLAAYIYPGVRGWTTIAYEPEEGEVDVEEAYATFETLPWKSSATVGRRLIDFGIVNPIHQHFRPYTDSPLAFTQLFGEAYIDDGFLYSVLLPTPGDLSVKLSAGIYDGRKELVEAEEEDEPALEFDGHVLQLGAAANHPLGESMDLSTGYNVLLDDFDGDNLAIHEANVVLRYYVPNSYKKVLWQNELYAAQTDALSDPVGFFTLLRYTHNKYWNVGLRFDWTELLDDDSNEAWALVPSVTWNITEATYARFQYRHLDVDNSSDAEEFFLQFVFGFGPHSHRIEF